MAYQVYYTNSFKKNLKLCNKRGYNISLLTKAITILEEKGVLPAKYKPHKLTGNYKNLWECHIQPDWLLIWEQNDKELILLFTNTSTHSDLFD